MYRPALRLGIKDSGPREWSVSAINKLKTNERKIFTYLISSHEKTANEHSFTVVTKQQESFPIYSEQNFVICCCFIDE